MIKIAPSIFASNFIKLEETIKFLESLGVDYIHYDIMDNHFVPNISFGPLIVEQVSSYTSIKGDIHLMISLSKEKVKRFFIQNIEFITVHIEAEGFSYEILDYIKSNGYKVGISIKPKTNVSILKEFINMIDMVLIMSVEPGFSGQEFIPESIEKVKEAREIISKSDKTINIEIDGGVNLNNIELLVKNGANILVIGSAFFKNDDAKKIMSTVKKLSFNL